MKTITIKELRDVFYCKIHKNNYKVSSGNCVGCGTVPRLVCHANHVVDGYTYWVRCDGCKTSISSHTEILAVYHWNTANK